MPDVHNLLVKGRGVFCNPQSPSAPAKLRLLFELAPIALVVTACGGYALTNMGEELLEVRTGERERERE